MASRLAPLALLALSVLASPAARSSCSTPSIISGYNNARLPNPFVLNNGQPVRDLSDWECKRSQIGALIQGYEAGNLPPRPPIVSGSIAINGTSGNLTVTAGLSRSNTATFSASITYPSGRTPAGGWPLLIAYAGLSIPVPDGIAVLVYDNDAIGQQDSNPASRGVGLFFNVYGSNATASAMTAWVWGVSRIIDVLERTPKANISTKKIAVTGCSRDGKGALMAGAFETRIALTIPQESGSGGDTCWRLSNYEQNSGDVVQQATEIVTENVWFSQNFDNYVNNLSVLPYDHHELIAMVAPRGLIGYENTDFEWLSPLSAYGCELAGHTVYQALGVPDNHGFVQVGNHSHCYFPPSLNSTLLPFFDKFLLGDKKADTRVFETNGLWNGTIWDQSYWINWVTPYF